MSSPKSEPHEEEKAEEEKVDESKIKRRRTRMVPANEDLIQKYPDGVYWERRSRANEEVPFQFFPFNLVYDCRDANF